MKIKILPVLEVSFLVASFIVVAVAVVILWCTGCKSTVITIPRQNLKPVKIVDQRALWDTEAKAVYVYVDPNTVHIEVGQVRSVSDANSLEAVADVTGNVVLKAIMP